MHRMIFEGGYEDDYEGLGQRDAKTQKDWEDSKKTALGLIYTPLKVDFTNLCDQEGEPLAFEPLDSESLDSESLDSFESFVDLCEKYLSMVDALFEKPRAACLDTRWMRSDPSYKNAYVAWRRNYFLKNLPSEAKKQGGGFKQARLQQLMLSMPEMACAHSKRLTKFVRDANQYCAGGDELDYISVIDQGLQLTDLSQRLGGLVDEAKYLIFLRKVDNNEIRF